MNFTSYLYEFCSFLEESDFPQMSPKNNIFPVIVFGELFENLQLISTEA